MKIFLTIILILMSSSLFSASIDSELDKYWGEKRKIKIIQKKEFTKTGKFEVSLYSGVIPNDAFYNAIPVGLKMDYYFNEFLSINLLASYDISYDASSVSTLEELGVILNVVEKPNWHAMLGVDYSFLYGKAAFGKNTLSYFDMYGSLMLGMYGTKYFDKDNPTEDKMGFNFAWGLGLGIRLYLTKNISFRLEGRQEFFLRSSEQGGIQKPLELVAGVGILF